MTANFLQADVANLVAEIDALFTVYPELADDEDLRRDCVEGETDAFSVLTRILSQEREADSMAKAIAARMSDLAARKARATKKQEAMRALMLRVLKSAGIAKAPLAEATVSVSKGRDSVDVTDVNRLPKWAYAVERKPDKKAIMERLAANKNVPGAALVTGGETITVRVG